MISMLTFSNADEILHIADTYTLDRVKHFYTNKVLTNFDEFSRTEQFLQLPAKQLARQVRLFCAVRPGVHDRILFSFRKSTRQHSSRMPTAHLPTILCGLVATTSCHCWGGGGVSPQVNKFEQVSINDHQM